MISKRLDDIQRRKRATIARRYKHSHLSKADIDRLAELQSMSPIRVIAETALSLLPKEQTEALLNRFEP